jgi:hypothetical protein
MLLFGRSDTEFHFFIIYLYLVLIIALFHISIAD